MANNGLAATLAAMERVKQAAKEAAMERMIKGAQEVADAQRQLVPVDEGNLKASITVTMPGQSTPAHSQPGGSTRCGRKSGDRHGRQFGRALSAHYRAWQFAP